MAPYFPVDLGTREEKINSRGGETRTLDLALPKRALYQLSHAPIVYLFYQNTVQ